MSIVTWKDVPTRTVEVAGVEFAYRELGAGSDVPVVFLHHFTAVLDDWDPRVIDGIAAEHRVIAFDSRGVGATGGSVPHTVEEMGRDAIAFIRALGLEKVDLFGFSLGGGVAQMVALQAPDLVRRVILAGTGPRGAEVQVGPDRWSVAARELDDGSERDEAWSLAAAVYPGFDSYQRFTDRQIPVAVLARRAGQS